MQTLTQGKTLGPGDLGILIHDANGMLMNTTATIAHAPVAAKMEFFDDSAENRLRLHDLAFSLDQVRIVSP